MEEKNDILEKKISLLKHAGLRGRSHALTLREIPREMRYLRVFRMQQGPSWWADTRDLEEPGWVYAGVNAQ